MPIYLLYLIKIFIKKPNTSLYVPGFIYHIV